MSRTVEVGGVKRVIKGTTKATKGAPRSKRPGANNGGARQRYWATGRLRLRKIAHLMAYNGFTAEAAARLWDATRGLSRNRMKT